MIRQGTTGRALGDGGFSLIEVIVALAIVAFALAAFGQTLGGAYRVSGRTHLQAAALAYAQAHLDTLGADGTLASGDSTGRYANGMPWRLSIAPLAALGPGSLADVRPKAAADELAPWWIVLEAFDAGGGTELVRLETAKVLRAAP
jgi:general secretion pathway protein I